MSIKDQIKEAAQAASELRSFDIRDWEPERKPIEITAFGSTCYCLPLSLDDMKKAARRSSGSGDLEKIYTIILCLLDVNGEPLLDFGDKRYLLGTSTVDVDDIYNQMNQAGDSSEVRTIWYKPLTVGERDLIKQASKNCNYTFIAHQFALKVLDDQGNRLYSDDDIPLLMSGVEGALVAEASGRIGSLRGIDDFLA